MGSSIASAAPDPSPPLIGGLVSSATDALDAIAPPVETDSTAVAARDDASTVEHGDNADSEPGITEPLIEPVLGAASEPIIHPVVEPVVQAVAEPVIHTVVEPVVQAVAEPVIHTVVEPVNRSVVAPVVHRVVASVVQAVVEPVVRTVVEPVDGAVAPVVTALDRTSPVTHAANAPEYDDSAEAVGPEDAAATPRPAGTLWALTPLDVGRPVASSPGGPAADNVSAGSAAHTMDGPTAKAPLPDEALSALERAHSISSDLDPERRTPPRTPITPAGAIAPGTGVSASSNAGGMDIAARTDGTDISTRLSGAVIAVDSQPDVLNHACTPGFSPG